MKMHIYHGRIDPHTGGTDIEGNECDDWGFEGPTLRGIEAVDYTYDNWMLDFETEEALRAAEKQTGWATGNGEFSLSIETQDGCIRLFNKERNRFEFFGDFYLTQED